MIASASSLTLAIVSASLASAFRRSSGSVLEGRTLNHQSAEETVRPSSSSSSMPSRVSYAERIAARRAAWSVTVELISPEPA